MQPAGERGLLRGIKAKARASNQHHGLAPALARPSWPNPSEAGREATLPIVPMGQGGSWHQPTLSGLRAQHGQGFPFGECFGKCQWVAERVSLR